MTKTLFAALVGCPNVGKSSILNRLLGRKLAIVSPKPQTTRSKIMGVLTQTMPAERRADAAINDEFIGAATETGERETDSTQFVFTDTPGLHRPRTLLGENMVKAVGEGIAGGDLAVLVTEPKGEPRPAELELLQRCQKLKLPVILAVNKIDTLDSKSLLLEKLARFAALYDFAAQIPVSALKNDGIDALMAELEAHAAEGPHFFPDDTLTDQPERVLAAEIIREKLLLNLQQEIPHETAVLVESWEERSDGLISIGAAIYCGKERHKGMILGKGGENLKKISASARADMERFFGARVYLRCFVKSREGWQNSAGTLKELGL
ncbi:MAG: GTPase Era [Oscillospiraceae bacterium]|nr:GTPase Era [Oscillospiraceae bacterium]